MTKGRAIELIVEKSYPLPIEGAGVRLMYAISALKIAEEDARKRAVKAFQRCCKEYRAEDGACIDDPTEITDCRANECCLCEEFLAKYDNE